MEKEFKNGVRSGLIRDFGWYFASSGLPLLVGLVKTPVFTRHFSTEDFGSLGVVQVTYSYLGMLLFSWISSCLWRYYQKYKLNERLELLNGNLLLFSMFSFVVLSAFSGAWFSVSENPLVKELIPVSFLHLIFSQLVMGYLVVARLEARAALYTVFQSLRALLSFALSLILVFYFELSITALITGLAVVDGLTLLVLAAWNPVRLVFRIKGFRREETKELLSYGAAGLVLNISLLSLNISDRYVVLYSEGLSSVGVYDQVYKISQLSIAALVTVFFNTVNPQLFKALEQDFKGSLMIMGKYFRVFLSVGLPIVLYLSLFAKEISQVLLGPGFREAFRIMPWIFVAAFLQGLSNFYELRMKFSGKMRLLTLVFLAGALFNLMLNLLLVPEFGYYWAAVSTVLTYLLVIAFFVYRDPALISSFRFYKAEITRLFVLLAIQSVIFISVEKYHPPMAILYGLGLIFVLSYAWLLKHQGFFED